MAGGHIFLEPILQNTVVAPINNISAAIEPLPGKIDEQIDALVNVSKLVGSGASALNITPGTDNILTLIDMSDLVGATLSANNTRVVNFTASAITQGRLNIILPAFNARYILSRNTSGQGIIRYIVKDETASAELKNVYAAAAGGVAGDNRPITYAGEVFEMVVTPGHKYSVTMSITMSVGYSTIQSIELSTVRKVTAEYKFYNPMVDGAIVLG